jgi:hypothetical protein
MKLSLKSHLIDTNAITATVTPVLAGIETLVADISKESFINSRLLAAVLQYGGFGSIFSKGRDIS